MTNPILNLLAAIESGHTKTVRKILSENPDLCYKRSEDESGFPFCKNAAYLGYHEIVELLLEFGEHPNSLVFWTEECSGRYLYFTVLHRMGIYASPCREDHVKVGEVLIRHGADVDARDYHGRTPLEFAIQKGNLDWAEFLLENGAGIHNLNWKPFNRDYCVLKKSDEYSRRDVLKLLIKYGLEPEFLNEEGQNLFDVFICYVQKDHDDVDEILKILIEHGVSMDGSYGGGTGLGWSVCTGNCRLVSFIIDQGADVNQKDARGRSALSFAVTYENLEVVDLLLSRGADVNHQDGSGVSPLLWAVTKNKCDTVDLLLSRGADINVRTCYGRTPLHKACSNLCKEIINLLVLKGADISAEDENGNTPFLQLLQYSLSVSRFKECVSIMVKEFAKSSFENKLVLKKDMDMIKKNSEVRELYEKCLTDLENMSNTKFHEPYSYYSVLKMSTNVEKMANLIRNDKFVAKFERNLSKCIYYQNDLRRIFKEALEVKEKREAAYSELYAVFQDHLPDVVIRKLANNHTSKNSSS